MAETGWKQNLIEIAGGVGGERDDVRRAQGGARSGRSFVAQARGDKETGDIAGWIGMGGRPD
jgi:hypothetical protein